MSEFNNDYFTEDEYNIFAKDKSTLRSPDIIEARRKIQARLDEFGNKLELPFIKNNLKLVTNPIYIKHTTSSENPRILELL